MNFNLLKNVYFVLEKKVVGNNRLRIIFNNNKNGISKNLVRYLATAFDILSVSTNRPNKLKNLAQHIFYERSLFCLENYRYLRTYSKIVRYSIWLLSANIVT